MMAMPWRPTSPLSRPRRLPARAGSDDQPVFDHPNARRVDEDAVALAAIHDLGVAGDQLHAGDLRRLLQALHHGPQGLHRQAFFQDEAAAQVTAARRTWQDR